MNIQRLACTGVAAMLLHSGYAQQLPLDTAVRTGRLANGFTYFIRHNEEPKNRVQLYLVNKVGSVLEDDDQRGLAHFLEHMNFNGTKHFPKNALVDYLQKAGVRFGADLNAYTTFDETVYQLPLPTEDATLVKNGIMIMRDWAQEATLDADEIEKERGIVLEEERLGKGAQERMSRQFFPVLLNHSRYANRLPIGLDSILLHFKRPVIERFYHDWYRPNLQALIVVGDIDVNQVEKMVKEHFSTLKNPANPRARTTYDVPLTGANQFLTVTDPETSSTELQILIKHKAPAALETQADYLASMKRSLFNQLLNTRRYVETSQEPNPAFVNAGMGIQGIIKGVDAFGFSVTAKDGQLEKAFQQTWAVVEKVKRFGFTQEELDRAKQNYLRNMESALNEKSKTPSASFVKEYQELFLNKEAAPGIDWEYRFVKDHIGSITLADISAVANEYLKETNRDILVLAPEKNKSSLPGNETIVAWLQKAGGEKMVAYKEEQGSLSLMAVKPAAGKVMAKDSVPALQVTTFTLNNGVKVVLKPTAFKNDEIRFRAFSAGGTSVYNDSMYDAAVNADKIIGSFGVGDLTPVQLSKVLNGKVVSVGPYISNRSQGFNGASAVADLETALQLVYLQFTRPRTDSMLYSNIINGSRAMLPNRYAQPGNVFNDTISYIMGNYSYRAAPPSIAKLERITMEKALTVYKDRFSDASGLTFVFVGNFKTDSIRPLLEQYLGALPSSYKKETARDLHQHIPEGQLIKNVYEGTENKATVRLVISGDYSYSPLNNLLLNATGEVLQIKLLEHLREQAGEVYSPSVQTSYNKNPQNRFAVIISFGCAPENVDHLVGMVKQEMESLRTKGAEAADVEKYKAGYLKNVELALQDNNFWLSYLSGQYENQENVLQVLDMKKNLDKLTPAALKDAAGVFLNDKNFIRFVLLPAKL
jgi:zinc protease